MADKQKVKKRSKKDWCKAYRMRGQRERNKRRKIERHLRRHPTDNVARMALKNVRPRA